MGAAQCKEACDEFASHIPTSTKACNAIDTCPALPWYLEADVDCNGCRIFPPLPPAGQHPRLFFTESEIPAFVARHTHTHLKTILGYNASEAIAHFRGYHSSMLSLPKIERDMPGREAVERFFTKDERRNEGFLTTYIQAFISSDGDLTKLVKEAVLFYARVIVASESLARGGNIKDKPYDIWHTTNWDMTTSFLFGGAAYALLYDLMFTSMSSLERALMRKSISLAVTGRRAWGMGWPARRIQSNWAPYQGDLLVLAAAIEGEEGADQLVIDLFQDMMMHFLDFSIYDSGHPVEDTYNPNLAFREGSMAFLAMARRGYNLFKKPHFVDIWRKWMPHALEPHADGGVYGGSSGSSFPYPTAAFIAKYMYPKDPVMDYVYRHYLCHQGGEYRRLYTSQTRWAAAIFALPAMNESMTPRSAEEDLHDASNLNLPLTFHCNNRGKVIMRSDWTQQAIAFTLDARPDGFLIGHDTASRGAFVLNACGRRWADCPEWNLFKESTDYSLLTIDGIGQAAKAPFVKLLGCVQGSRKSTFSAADLTYAANYTWTQWAKPGADMSAQGWEREPHSPFDFGMNAWWLPNKLYDEPGVGFTGLYQWRKRFNTVSRVTRSSLMVRDTPLPFVIIADDAVKDDDEHEYAWCMTTPADVVLTSFDGRDAVLGEQGNGNRRLLVRILAGNHHNGKMECTLQPFSKPDPKRKLSDGSFVQIPFARLRFKCKAKELHLKLGFFPLATPSTALPVTYWEEEGDHMANILSVNASIRIQFDMAKGSARETMMNVIV